MKEDIKLGSTETSCELMRCVFDFLNEALILFGLYKVVQIRPGLFTLVYIQISPGHI